jgi:hypothetical protein
MSANFNPAARPPRSNRRLARRLPPHPGIQVVCRRRGGQGEGDNLAISMLDISEDGAGLFLAELVRPQEGLTLWLDLEGGIHPLKIPVVVAWALPTTGGTCCAGVRFAQRLAFEDFVRLSDA